MKGLPKLVLSVAVAMCVSLPANAGLFNISINNLGGLTPSQSSAFDGAVAFWETYLTGVQSVFDHSIVIDASGAPIDGVGRILGSAGPSSIIQFSDSAFVYANRGSMQFDTADLSNMERNGTLFDVIVHEMACYRIWNFVDNRFYQTR